MSDKAKVWVAPDGSDKGVWIELPCPKSKVVQLVSGATGIECDYDDLVIGDYEELWDANLTEGLKYCETIDEANLYAKALEVREDEQLNAMSAWISTYSTPETLNEYLNLALQAADIQFYDYEFPAYSGNDPVYATINESTSKEEKFGWYCVDRDPQLKEMLEGDSPLRDALDMSAFGRGSALRQDAVLYDNGFIDMKNDSVDLNRYMPTEAKQLIETAWDVEHIPTYPHPSQLRVDTQALAPGEAYAAEWRGVELKVSASPTGDAWVASAHLAGEAAPNEFGAPETFTNYGRSFEEAYMLNFMEVNVRRQMCGLDPLKMNNPEDPTAPFSAVTVGVEIKKDDVEQTREYATPNRANEIEQEQGRDGGRIR